MKQRHRAFVHYGARAGGGGNTLWQIWKACGLYLTFFPQCYESVQSKIMQYIEQQLALSVQCCPSLEEQGLRFYVCLSSLNTPDRDFFSVFI